MGSAELVAGVSGTRGRRETGAEVDLVVELNCQSVRPDVKSCLALAPQQSAFVVRLH